MSITITIAISIYYFSN